jgi:hypothetical protein
VKVTLAFESQRDATIVICISTAFLIGHKELLAPFITSTICVFGLLSA